MIRWNWNITSGQNVEGNWAIESKPQRFQPSWPETFLFRQIFLSSRYCLIFSLFLKLLLSLLNQFFSPILSRGLSNSLPFFWGFSAFFLSFSVADSAEGSRGSAPPPPHPLIFWANWGLKGRTNVFFGLWKLCNCILYLLVTLLLLFLLLLLVLLLKVLKKIGSP